jgi:hypothetical protein
MNTKIENGIIKSINFFSKALKIGTIYSIGGINRLYYCYVRTQRLANRHMHPTWWASAFSVGSPAKSA